MTGAKLKYNNNVNVLIFRFCQPNRVLKGLVQLKF